MRCTWIRILKVRPIHPCQHLTTMTRQPIKLSELAVGPWSVITMHDKCNRHIVIAIMFLKMLPWIHLASNKPIKTFWIYYGKNACEFAHSLWCFVLHCFPMDFISNAPYPVLSAQVEDRWWRKKGDMHSHCKSNKTKQKTCHEKPRELKPSWSLSSLFFPLCLLFFKSSLKRHCSNSTQYWQSINEHICMLVTQRNPHT